MIKRKTTYGSNTSCSHSSACSSAASSSSSVPMYVTPAHSSAVTSSDATTAPQSTGRIDTAAQGIYGADRVVVVAMFSVALVMNGDDLVVVTAVMSNVHMASSSAMAASDRVVDDARAAALMQSSASVDDVVVVSHASTATGATSAGGISFSLPKSHTRWPSIFSDIDKSIIFADCSDKLWHHPKTSEETTASWCTICIYFKRPWEPVKML